MRRSRQFRTSIALVLGLVALIATADSPQLNRDLSSLYVDAAENSAINVESALALVDAALDFDPVSSDALFLRAYLRRNVQEDTTAVLSDLLLALDNANFTSIDPNQATIVYAGTLLRTRRAGEALAALEAADLARPDVDSVLVADALFIRARASAALERGRDASSAIAEGRSLFPDDPRFFLLELESETSPSFRYRRELDRLLRAGVDGPSMQAALLRYALTAPIVAERRWAYATYLEVGGEDPSVSLALSGSDDTGLVETFTRLGGYQRRDVFLPALDGLRAPGETREQTAAAAASDALARLLEAAQRQSGYSVADADRDGFWEERLTLSAGAVLRWETDADQNGINEVDVLFAGGEPMQVTVDQPAGPVLAVYDSYPFVANVTIPMVDGSIRYNILPFGIRTPIIQTLPVGGPRLESILELPAGFVGLDLGAVRLAAANREERDAQGRVVEVRSLQDGVTIRSRRDSNGDGGMDHLVIYDAGLPVTGLRDIDGDGYFEVAEAYSAGRIAMVSVDEDDNGTPDVTEYAREDGEREWDLDQDGAIDVREFGIWTDSVRLQFPFLENRR